MTSWEEVCTAKDENRRELTLHGQSVNKRIDKDGLDSQIFTLTSLNSLKIAGTPLKSIPEELKNLTNLTALMLENNKLTTLPESVGNLKSLKSLDVSGNNLTKLPDSVSNLSNLQSLNANLNQLESFPSVANMKQLSFLSISRNKLLSLPEGLDASLSVLSTIEASHNEITDIEPTLSQLPRLTKLDVSTNKLTCLPFELSECLKLKELMISDNKMKDRKLLKLSDHSTKSLLAYLGTFLEKQRAQESGGKDRKDKTKKRKKGGKKEEEEIDRDVISVLRFEDGLTVYVTPNVAEVRPYLVCCIVRDLNFSKSHNMFKRFINLQTKLHEGVCQKRQSATIATHDLQLIKGPLVYDALLPADIQIVPLFKSEKTTGAELFKKLKDEADAYRKEKKKSTLSGIHKYLDLLKGKALYPCLKDAEGEVVSFPPITNSEKTKISSESKNILLEVTSTVSLEMAKRVMEELLTEILLTGVGTVSNDDAGASTDVSLEAEVAEKVDLSRVRVPQNLTVEQVKVTDMDGSLKVIYPSRIDLNNPNFDVRRNYE